MSEEESGRWGNSKRSKKASEYSELVRSVKKNYQWGDETRIGLISFGIPILIAVIFFQDNLSNFFLLSALSVLIGIISIVLNSFISVLNEENYVSSCVRKLEEYDIEIVDRIRRRATVNTNVTLIFTFLPNVFLIFFLVVVPEALDVFNSADASNTSIAVIGSFIALFLIIAPIVVLYTHYMIRRAHINIIIQHACIEHEATDK